MAAPVLSKALLILREKKGITLLQRLSSGSFILGLFMAFMLKHPTYHYPRLFFAVGFLGAYTTFSTFSFESLQLLQNGRPLLSLTYVISSAVLGVSSAWFGFTLGRFF